MIVDLWSASTKLSRNRLVGTLGWRSAFDGSQLPTTRLLDRTYRAVLET